ncbi:MAG: AmpG family muropeptide MFS transporter [Bdellovibrionales bacterium]
MRKIIELYANPKMLLITILGFSSGLPFALTGSTLQAWLTDANIDVATVGIFSLVGFPYTIKYLWSPFLDSIAPPFGGRRRGWAIIILIGLIASELFLATLDPSASLTWVGIGAFFVALFSASQDIVIDALRTESLEKIEYGAGAATFNMGYRISMLVSGAVALSMADHLPWRTVYLVMAAIQCIGLFVIYFAPEPQIKFEPIKTFHDRVINPFADFFRRVGVWEILAFVMIYKLGTMMGTALSTRFLMELGFTKTEIGAVSKVVGLIATIVGALSGGALMSRYGMKKSLWVFGILQSVGILTFIILAIVGNNHFAMVAVIGAENFMIGLGVAAIQGFIMSVCSLQYTGTQFALLSSLTAVTRVIFTSQSGRLVASFGWVNYFLFSAALAIPGLLLLTQYSKWSTGDHQALREVKKTDFKLILIFLSGLIIMCTEVLWRFMDHAEWGPYAAVGGAVISCLALLTGIIHSRRVDFKN